MTEADIYRELTGLFRELFGDDDLVLTPRTTASDVEGWDSFNHLNLIVATETRFDIRLNASEVETLHSVGDLVTIIQAKTGKKP